MFSRDSDFYRLFSVWSGLAILASILLIPASATAEETRTGKLEAEQAQKATTLQPFQPNKAERLVLRIQKWGLLSGTGRGFYPIIFGSAFPSGGSAFGGGYRQMFGDTGAFDVHGSYTFTNTKLLMSSVHLPLMAEDRLRSSVVVKYQDAPEVAFFGVGNESSDEDESNYAFTPKSVRGWAALDLSRYVTAGGEVAYEDYDVAEGESSRNPSIEEVFSPAEVPGFGLDSRYIMGNVFAYFDWRQSPGYTTSGGFYRVDWTNYSQQEGDGFNFRRWDFELVQHLPILRANQILSFRGLATITDVDENQEIPFYLLPKLGGGKELRGFRDFRFLDRHRMLLTAEYRWTPSKFMDLALWYEVGKVASETSDLNFEDLHDSYGIGARFHSPTFTFLRIELAHSTETTRIIFSGGPAF